VTLIVGVAGTSLALGVALALGVTLIVGVGLRAGALNLSFVKL